MVYFSRLREGHRWVFLHLSCHQTGLRGVKVCLPSLLSRPPAMSPGLKIKVHHESILDETRILSVYLEKRRDPST